MHSARYFLQTPTTTLGLMISSGLRMFAASVELTGAKQLLTTFGMLLGCIGMNLL